MKREDVEKGMGPRDAEEGATPRSCSQLGVQVGSREQLVMCGLGFPFLGQCGSFQ